MIWKTKQELVNTNGLTFDQWLAAAGRMNDNKGLLGLLLSTAWGRGEDPCEWRSNPSSCSLEVSS